eukprot:7458997-Karenia_brevis.AAC.1
MECVLYAALKVGLDGPPLQEIAAFYASKLPIPEFEKLSEDEQDLQHVVSCTTHATSPLTDD